MVPIKHVKSVAQMSRGFAETCWRTPFWKERRANVYIAMKSLHSTKQKITYDGVCYFRLTAVFVVNRLRGKTSNSTWRAARLEMSFAPVA